MWEALSSAASSATSTLAEAASTASSTLNEAAASLSEVAAKEKDALVKELHAASTPSAEPEPAWRSPSKPAPSAAAALTQLGKVGWSLLNPLDDAAAAAGDGAAAELTMLPWEQPGLAESVRSRMRALSQDDATFVAPPPPDRDDGGFTFAMEDHVRVITEALSVDKHLERQRHLLVPKTLSEEAFFRNYFHHLHALAHAAESPAASSSPLVTSEVHSEPASEASSSVNVAAPSPPPEEKFELLASEVASRLGSGGGEGGAGAAVDEVDAFEEELRRELEGLEPR